MASLSISFIPFFLLYSCLSSSIPTNLIETTCSSTSYHDFCIAAIATATTDPQNSSATANTRNLSSIFISLALFNATNSSSYVTALATSPATNEAIRPLLHACSLKYASAGEALTRALQELSAEESAESNDYAFIHASAAAEYPVDCRLLFENRRRKPAVTVALYPSELAQREEDLKRLCTVAVEIILLLG